MLKMKEFDAPVTDGDNILPREVVEVIRGIGIVRITPALVPTHNKSLHTRRAVILRQAALCWRIMSSAAVNNIIKFHIYPIIYYFIDKDHLKTCVQYFNYLMKYTPY